MEEGQVFISLGKGGASLIWAKVFKEKGVDKKVYLADIQYAALRCIEN